MKKILKYLVIISFFLMIIFLGTFKIVNFDFGWHLKTGEYIFYNKTIPGHDIFSYIAQGNKWVDSHWLFQLILYITYHIGGTNGVVILRILILLSLFSILFMTIHRKEYTFISIIVCIFALFISFQRFIMRPEIFSFLFLAIFFYFTERFSEHPMISLIIIPICQVFWANSHGLYILGIIFLFLYLLGDVSQAILSKYLHFIHKPEISKKEWKQKGLLFFITSIAALVNANGKEGIIYPFKIFYELRKKPAIFAKIVELIPPFSSKNLSFPDPAMIYKIFLLFSILTIICQLKNIRFAHLFPYGAFLYLSLLGVRNIPLFAIIATPITIRNLYGISDFFLTEKREKILDKLPLLLIINLSLITIAVLVCIFIANNKLYQRLHYLRTFGIGESNYYPKEAVEYLKLRDFPGNIFNSSDIGGYLIWKLYPQKQVALDGRWEVYGDFLLNLEHLRSPIYFTQLVRKYRIDVIILHKRSIELQLMEPWLNRNPYWLLSEDTPIAVVYESRYPSY